MADPFDKLLAEEQTSDDRLALARALLAPLPRRDPAWPALGAAAFFAACAMIFAVGAVLAPPVKVAPLPTAAAVVQ